MWEGCGIFRSGLFLPRVFFVHKTRVDCWKKLLYSEKWMQNRGYNLNETACLEIRRRNRCYALDAIKRTYVALCFSLSLYRFQISNLFIFCTISKAYYKKVTTHYKSKAQFRRRASAVSNLIVIWFDCSMAGKQLWFRRCARVEPNSGFTDAS